MAVYGGLIHRVGSAWMAFAVRVQVIFLVDVVTHTHEQSLLLGIPQAGADIGFHDRLESVAHLLAERVVGDWACRPID